MRHNTMRTTQLGTTGIEVSAICLGTACYGSSIDQSHSYELLDLYHEYGGRFLDTANCYLKPLPDQTFSEWVRTDRSMLDYCKSRNIIPLAHSSLLWGAYARSDKPLWEKYVGEHSTKRLSVLRDIASQLGATPNQVVIAWMIQNDPAVIPVVGASSPEQLEENLQATSVQLSVEQLYRLNKA